MARSVRGIEEVLAAEIGRRGLGRVVAVGHREVRFVAGPGGDAPATADDLFVLAAEVDGIGAAAADLARLVRAVAAADLDRALAVRADRGGPPATWLDVSASALGRRRFSRFDVEDAVGGALAARLGLEHRSRRSGPLPPGGLGWRVALVGDRASVAVRIGARPLHRRAWKQATVPGTLHPPLAAAMVALAGVAPGERVLDPCCGAGTLLIEAAREGARGIGIDLDPAALAAAVANAGRAEPGAEPAEPGARTCVPGPAGSAAVAADPVLPATMIAGSVGSARSVGSVGSVGSAGLARSAGSAAGPVVPAAVNAAGSPALRWVRADAGALPVATGSVDRVLLNPPWGRRVPPAGALAHRPGRLVTELSRVLAPGGTAVLLVPDAAAGTERAGLVVERRIPVALAGVRLAVLVLRG